VGREENPSFQVGKGKEMRLSEILMNFVKSSDQERVFMEKDQRYSLIIGGINIFLPIILMEVNAHAKSAAAAKVGQLAETVIREEMEQILKSSHIGEQYENSDKWLKNFSQGVEQGMTLALESTVEEEAYNIDLYDLCD
jgi:hypothetical protein